MRWPGAVVDGEGYELIDTGFGWVVERWAVAAERLSSKAFIS
ncbi:hypothetical protein ACL02S_23250 [Nocardia sp. 004]